MVPYIIVVSVTHRISQHPRKTALHKMSKPSSTPFYHTITTVVPHHRRHPFSPSATSCHHLHNRYHTIPPLPSPPTIFISQRQCHLNHTAESHNSIFTFTFSFTAISTFLPSLLLPCLSSLVSCHLPLASQSPSFCHHYHHQHRQNPPFIYIPHLHSSVILT